MQKYREQKAAIMKILVEKLIVGAEAVLTCTNNQCFEQKQGNPLKFFSLNSFRKYKLRRFVFVSYLINENDGPFI